MKKETTDQVSVTPPTQRNPTGKGGFGDNPQNRNPGGWDRTQSISYQYNRIGRMSDEELNAFVPENQFQQIALQRVKSAKGKLGLNDAKEITDRTEGKAPQFIGVGDKDDYDKLFDELTLDELRKLANGN